MVHAKDSTAFGPSGRDAALEYVLEMLAELARMARKSGETGVAIHIEAIIAARRATAGDRSAH